MAPEGKCTWVFNHFFDISVMYTGKTQNYIESLLNYLNWNLTLELQLEIKTQFVVHKVKRSQAPEGVSPPEFVDVPTARGHSKGNLNKRN
jgi:hypothetical protein